jgi:hypothetical protein
VYVAPVGVLRGYLIDSPYSASTALRRSVSLAGVEVPYLLSAYRKPVYVYFASLDGVASSASTSAVRRYAVSEYGDAYSQYTASNRAFKFEAIERPADWFFRVSPVRKFYEFNDILTAVLGIKPVYLQFVIIEPLTDSFTYKLASRAYADYEGLYASVSYTRTVSPLLAVQLTAYRPRIRYTSYSVSEYYVTYDSVGYIKSVSPLLAVQLTAYRPRFRYVSFSVSELYLLYESSAVRTRPVYSVESYEGLYEPVYAPTVKYYNIYFVNVYRYANIYDLEKPYESIKYEKKSAGFSFTSYEGLYEGFIAQKG